MNNIFQTEYLLKKTNLFWQYPVITEKEFYNQNKNNPLFFGFPWATCIDKNINTNTLIKILLPFIKHKNYFSCCQHIHFRKFLPLLKILGIKTLYIPHKIKGEDELYGIKLKPCPLYAVNFEDNNRNNEFKDIDFENIERKYLFTFMGGYQNIYLSDIRPKIFKLKYNDIKIRNTGTWHFNSIVYSNKQNNNGELNDNEQIRNKTKYYNKLLLDSRYSLCPSGSGPNSIRFWESLACGSIPVLLADTLELPEEINWNDTIIQYPENKINDLHNYLSNIPKERENQLRKNCLKVYNKLKNNFNLNKKTIVHYCCGSYDICDFGGVGRYDYHIKKIYPDRIFFKGPEQKEQMLKILPLLKNVLIITDNHLSCDIPNIYKVLLVHHGSALTHAERDPNWSPYWKKLCCDGQRKMLKIRKPEKTHIISISNFCYDEFLKYFPKLYPKFNNKLILHTSELNENIYKKKFNQEPIVLGNWNGFLKGEHAILKLINEKSIFKFEKLNIKYNKKNYKNYKDYNNAKQKIYCEADIFLQLSLSEGYSYSTLDAFLNGNIIVSTNVGLTYKDVPDNCYVKLDYQKINDTKYIIDKLIYAWKNKEELSKNARKFYLQNCNFRDWQEKMYSLINSL